MARIELEHRAARSARPVAGTAYARLRDALLPFAVIATVLAAWEATARSGQVTPFVLPAFSAVVSRIIADFLSGDLAHNAGATLWRALIGFLIAGAGGVALGLAMERSRWVRWFFDPIVSVGFPMPKIAFLPIVILWLGVYDTAKIAIIVFDAIFPVVTATTAAVSGVDRQIIWSARNMGASEQRILWQILLPAAFPQIMTGLQVALPLSLIVAIVAEMLMGGYGLGGGMMQASRFADSTGVFAGIIEIAVLGFALVKGMAMVRRRLLLWHAEAQAPSTA